MELWESSHTLSAKAFVPIGPNVVYVIDTVDYNTIYPHIVEHGKLHDSMLDE